MRRVLRADWARWCAAILVALLALSLLHAAAHHGATQRDCSTCKALNSPGVAHTFRGLARPLADSTEIALLPPADPLSPSARYHKPLRAPPISSVL